MSSIDKFDQPAFHSNDAAEQYDSLPISKLAVVTFLLGIFSVTTLLSTKLLILPIITIGLGLIVVPLLSRRGAQLAGVTLAQIGLGLAVVSAAWAITSANGKTEYLYAEAAEHAAHFLDTLSAGERYQALEMLQPEPGRQITGTDLQKYYDGLTDEVRSEEALGFLNGDTTAAIVRLGNPGNWEFVRGVEITGIHSDSTVTVDMRNTQAESGGVFRVAMTRRTGIRVDDANGTVAYWNVQSVSVPR